MRLLSKEIQVDFSRSMNRITFDRIISAKPETYPFVTLPQEEEEVIPDRGRQNHVHYMYVFAWHTCAYKVLRSLYSV